jgi:hypothetical protein
VRRGARTLRPCAARTRLTVDSDTHTTIALIKGKGNARMIRALYDAVDVRVDKINSFLAAWCR